MFYLNGCGNEASSSKGIQALAVQAGCTNPAVYRSGIVRCIPHMKSHRHSQMTHRANNKKGETSLASPLMRKILAAQFQAFKQALIAAFLSNFEVIKQLTATCHHLQKTTTGGVIFKVFAQMLGQVVDAVSEACDLHVCAACVLLMKLEGLAIDGCGFAHSIVWARLPGGKVHG